MFPTFWLTLAGVALPVAIAVVVLSRRRFSLLFPLALAFFTAATGIASSLLRHWAPGGVAKPLGILTLALAATLLWLWPVSRARWRVRIKPSWQMLLTFSLVAFLAVADQAVIFAKNRWGFETNLLFPKEETYFRFPLNSDNQRHAIVVSSLLQGGRSPFLPDSELLYQVHWHHFASVFVSFFDPLSYNAFVSGVALATGFLFFFSLQWAVFLLRPGLVLRPRWAVPLAILFICHAEILNLAASFVLTGVPGIAADSTFPSILSTAFSLKVAALTAPQHLFFLWMCVSFFVMARLLPKTGASVCLVATFPCLAFMASPLLFCVFFPFVALHEMRHDWRRSLVTWPLVLAAGFVSFWAAWGFSPLDLFLREMPTLEQGLGGEARHWRAAPALWVAMGGALGILVSLRFVTQLRQRRLPRSAAGLALLLGTLAIHLLIHGHEVYRHWSILSSMLAVMFLVWELPRSRAWLSGVRIAAAMALLAHAHFVHSYLTKPTVVSAEIPWRDYFEFNRVLRERYTNLGVVSMRYVIFPPVMEANPSFAMGIDTLVHSRVTEPQVRKILDADRDGILPHAAALGYRALLWGPLEQAHWHGRERCRFIHERNLMARLGSVSLYRLEDPLSSHPGRQAGASSSDRFALGALLTLSGWGSEGLATFRSGLPPRAWLEPVDTLAAAIREGASRLQRRDLEKYLASCGLKMPPSP